METAIDSDSLVSTLRTEVATLQDALAESQAKVRWFEEQIKLARQQRFGKKADNAFDGQGDLFDDMEGFKPGDTPGAADNTEEEKEEITYTRRKKTSGRKVDTSALPRERHVHDLPEEEKTCGCGRCMEKAGEDISEQLDYIPASLKVIEHVRIKYTCRHCQTLKEAPKPEQPIPKSMASANLLTEIILRKYDEHLPLYRQSKIFARDGIDIPDNTLGNWVMRSAEALEPLGNALWEQLLPCTYLQVDETPVKILKPDKKGYMWAYHSLTPDNRFIVFEFNISRSGDVPYQRLKDYQGILQTDGYSGYRALHGSGDIISLGCMDHARRKFTDAMKVCNSSLRGMSGKLFRLINHLYKIEREIKSAPDKRRYEIRQKKALPVLNDLFSLARSATGSLPPKSAIARAITYLLNNESFLREYVNHGRACISNCGVENQIRPFAVGRRNWLFAGNAASAAKSALLYSLIQTCKINKINPRHYLQYALTKVHAMRRGDIKPTSLLPQFIDKNLLAA